MGKYRRSCSGAALLLCLLLQITGGWANWEICRYDFADKEYHFSVAKSLEPGTVVGQVVFVTCGLKSNVRYESADPHFEVLDDGSVVVKDHLKLHKHKQFQVLALEGKNVLTETTVTLRKQHPHHKQDELSHPSKSEHQLRRQKRDWVIPPISCSENERGPFPKRLIQVKSNRATEITVFYSITGQGANSPPVGTFVMERNTGWLNVTRPLDRETIPSYLILVYAVSSNGDKVENPIDIVIKVTDQNDNRPVFTEPLFEGSVVEGSKPGTPVMSVSATDLDDQEDTNNGIVAYSIKSQEPELPEKMMFTISRETGLISVVSSNLDRELYPKYTLIIIATDQEGAGYEATSTAVINVVDANDNAPVFDPITYSAKVPENDVGFEVALLTVTDEDTVNSDAWTAVFKIVKGNEGNQFGITTTADNMGLLKTVKGLDFEAKRQHVLMIVATNKANFSVPLITSTATVTVDVIDVNEAPVFMPPVKDVTAQEDLPSGQEVASYTAQDPDKAQNQKITYRMGNDPAGWLSVNPENGIITGKELDRESVYVKNDTYKAIILAIDNGVPPATGTGTLLIRLLDVNDNGPYLEYQDIVYCMKTQDPLTINIIDKDLPPNTFPYRASLSREARENWTASVVDNKFELKSNREMEEETYHVRVTLIDGQDFSNDSTLNIQVCQCTAEGNTCDISKALAGTMGIPLILGILGGILALLILLLLLLLFVRKKRVVKEPLLPPDEDTRDNVYCYDEEGGGEEDQDFNLGELHLGLDNRPVVFRNDVVPTNDEPIHKYRPRPANPDEIGNFIEENLNAADNDPTAPPYDSLLVFDYEGSGSEAASLSSLNSSSSGGDQDYTHLNDWGPRFRKLADMYGGDED